MQDITSRKGMAHVTSDQFRAIVGSIVGTGSCIANIDEMLEPELSVNNTIKIRSGVLVHHGHIVRVPPETYDTVNYINGSQGMKRIDLVVSRYTRNPETDIENTEWVVIMGTPDASNPVVPDHIAGNMQNGDLVDDCPFLEIHYDGINVTEVKKLLEVGMTNKDLSDKLSGIKVTKKSYSMILEKNPYIQMNMESTEIPQEDIEQYGIPISAMFKGSSAAPGSAYVYTANDGKTYGYASCVDGTGTLIVTFLNI